MQSPIVRSEAGETGSRASAAEAMLTSAAATDAPGTRDWVFTVKCRTRPGEVVCLTGGCDSLGKWSSGGVARMARVDDAVDDDQSGSEEEPMVLKDEAVDLSKKGGG